MGNYTFFKGNAAAIRTFFPRAQVQLSKQLTSSTLVLPLFPDIHTYTKHLDFFFPFLHLAGITNQTPADEKGRK